MPAYELCSPIFWWNENKLIVAWNKYKWKLDRTVDCYLSLYTQRSPSSCLHFRLLLCFSRAALRADVPTIPCIQNGNIISAARPDHSNNSPSENTKIASNKCFVSLCIFINKRAAIICFVAMMSSSFQLSNGTIGWFKELASSVMLMKNNNCI